MPRFLLNTEILIVMLSFHTLINSIPPPHPPSALYRLSSPSHPQHPPFKFSLLIFTAQLLQAVFHPRPPVIQRLIPREEGALVSSEISPLGKKKRPSSGGDIK